MTSSATLPADGTGAVRSGRLAHVVVHGDALEYALRPPGQRLAAAQSKTRKGGLRPPMSRLWPTNRPWSGFTPAGMCTCPSVDRELTVLSAMSQRGVRVTFHARPLRRVCAATAALQHVPRRSAEAASADQRRADQVRGKRSSGSSRTANASTVETGDYRQALIDRGIEVTEKERRRTVFGCPFSGTWLPMILIFAIFFIFMRQLSRAGARP